MHPRRTHLGLVALVVLLSGAPSTRARRPMPDASENARPVNACQFSGAHVSGVVSVDLLDGTHAEVPLIDAAATVAMAPSLADVVVHVTEPARFSGRFVSRGLGGPGAYVPRTFRAPTGGVRVDGNVPFEVMLSSDPAVVRARLPSPYGGGVLSISIPCAALRAGAPRTDVRPPPLPRRPRLVTLASGAHVLSAAGHGTEIARAEREDSSRQPLTFVGTTGPSHDGFTQVSLRVGPARIEGFVPDGEVTALDDALPMIPPAGDYGVQVESTSHMTRVELPAGTALYGSPTATTPWATITAPLSAFLRPHPAGERAAITLASEVVEVHPCRFDGVAGRAPCGDASALPRMGFRACTGELCRELAFVTPP